MGREPSWNVLANVWELTEPWERLTQVLSGIQLHVPGARSMGLMASFLSISSFIIMIENEFFFLFRNNAFPHTAGFMCGGY